MSASLRRSALARVESMRSTRAAEVLRRAELEVRERESWESSDGPVRGVDVHVRVDGYALGLLDASPVVQDAVIEAVTAVAPLTLGASVSDLSFEWALGEQAGAPTYRDATSARVDPRSSPDVSRALSAYLAATGQPDAARAVEEHGVQVEGEVVRVAFDPSLAQAGLDALFGHPVRVRRG